MLRDDEIVAMAIAAIAEELGTDVKKIRVKSFSEVQKSDLEKYVEENHINYTKFSLEEMRWVNIEYRWMEKFMRWK